MRGTEYNSSPEHSGSWSHHSLIARHKLSHDLIIIIIKEASRGTGTQSLTVKPTGCGFVRFPIRGDQNIYLNLHFHFFALVSRLSAAFCSATQHAMPPELGRKWETECLNTTIRLPILLCAGYSVKLIYFYLFYYYRE